jgi:Zn ribbon nucleic-acid-binding protein
MNRYDRNARRLVVCSACKNDRCHVLRSEDGTVYVVCTSCGHEMLRAKSEAAAPA